MPEGALSLPRLHNFGPLTRSTEKELLRNWGPCPDHGKPKQICEEIKVTCIAILKGQGFYAKCSSLEEINSGGCMSVARKVHNEVDNVNIYGVASHDHVWIEYNNIHYDAEIPSGTKDPLNFPFFKRIPPDFILREMKRRDEKVDGKVPETIKEAIIEIE